MTETYSWTSLPRINSESWYPDTLAEQANELIARTKKLQVARDALDAKRVAMQAADVSDVDFSPNAGTKLKQARAKLLQEELTLREDCGEFFSELPSAYRAESMRLVEEHEAVEQDVRSKLLGLGYEDDPRVDAKLHSVAHVQFQHRGKLDIDMIRRHPSVVAVVGKREALRGKDGALSVVENTRGEQSVRVALERIRTEALAGV